MGLRRLYGPAQLTNAAATVYTAPAGIRAVVRHIHVSNPTAGPVNLTLSIGLDAAGTRVFDAYPIAAGSVLDHYCIYAIEPGEAMQAFGSVTGDLVLIVDGDLEVA
jgi:hypothetical protein